MKTTRLMALLIGSIFNMCFATPLVAQDTDVAVVVNSKNPLNMVTSADLRKILSGEKHSWSGGRPIVIVVRSYDSHERETLLHLLRMSESDYKEYWRAQIFRGEAAAEPVAVPSNGMQREALGIYPGAIALVEFRDVKQGMKVLSVDGHMPGDANYPLK